MTETLIGLKNSSSISFLILIFLSFNSLNPLKSFYISKKLSVSRIFKYCLNICLCIFIFTILISKTIHPDILCKKMFKSFRKKNLSKFPETVSKIIIFKLI